MNYKSGIAKRLRLWVLLLFLIYGQSVNASSVERLEKRVQELETLVQQLLQQLKPSSEVSEAKQSHQIDPTVDPADVLPEKLQELEWQVEEQQFLIDEASRDLNNSMKLAGYADVEYKGSSREGGKEEFRMHHLSLFFTRQFENDIKFFSEIEYEDAPKFDGLNDGSGELEEASGTIFVEAMNFDWNYNQYSNVRVGRFFTPAGIWSEDHYPPFVSTQERPMHIFKIYPQLVDGISGFGSTYLSDEISFDYNMFLGNGESSIAGKKDLNSNKATGFRGNFHFPWWDDLSAGFTLYNDNEDTANGNADKSAFGFHLKARYQGFTGQIEYAKANLEFADKTIDFKREGFYAQFVYNLDHWALGYRYDVYDPTTLNLENVKRHSLFLNYQVNESITLKTEYHANQFDDPLTDDFGFYIFSISTYLGR
ncbi:MAG: hypothetical protein ABJK37_03380 [Paraglaciecola sp.]|uniref:hypothetical protein n=1 Tax=Paraglaciecola sp. TaxID=1920173 RepID=UPI0032981FE1